MTRRLVEPVMAIDREHLRQLVHLAIKNNGPRCNLNHIDVSHVTDMSGLFAGRNFDGGISRWNTKNVTTMHSMFKGSHFNGNIRGWNVSRVVDMARMFENSHFNKDISRWSVAGANVFERMFLGSRFAGDISTWTIAPQSETTDMLPHEFKGAAPAQLAPEQWRRIFLGTHAGQRDYFNRAPFVPGMTWWLHLANEEPFSDAVPKELHRWLRSAQALGRELRMPRLDVASMLALGHPMSATNRVQLHRKFQEHYVTSSAMVDLLRPNGKMDYETWLFGVPHETRHRFQLVLSASQPARAPLEPYEVFELPPLD